MSTSYRQVNQRSDFDTPPKRTAERLVTKPLGHRNDSLHPRSEYSLQESAIKALLATSPDKCSSPGVPLVNLRAI